MTEAVTAFAPASIGNGAVGFDVLGLAWSGVGDRVSVRRRDADTVIVEHVLGLDGEPHPDLPTVTEQNTASIAAKAFWEAHGDGGLGITVRKGVPLQSGMGSSAASAVAAVVAANGLLAEPLATAALLPFALHGERYASGGLHADNVAPSLFGGLVLCPPMLLPHTVKLPGPDGVSAVLLHPELKVDTASARRLLNKAVTQAQWVEQQGYLAGFIAACHSGDLTLMSRTLKDVVIEPQRVGNVPCFEAVSRAALDAGALGVSLSGSGPSLFALCPNSRAPELAAVMERACRGEGIDCQSFLSDMNAPGACVET